MRRHVQMPFRVNVYIIILRLNNSSPSERKYKYGTVLRDLVESEMLTHTIGKFVIFFEISGHKALRIDNFNFPVELLSSRWRNSFR